MNILPMDDHDGHFRGAFVNSLMMVIGTELGDKTFFIAALLAMRKSQAHVWLGAWGALAFMTVLSVCMGVMLPTFLSQEYTHYAVVSLFAYFGLKLTYEAIDMYRKGEGDKVSDELEEVEGELAEASRDNETTDKKDDDAKIKAPKGDRSKPGFFSGALFATVPNVFMMTFLAEWGDRSQIATIAMAAAKDCFGVCAGAVLGHALCTGVAVMGGRILAETMTERSVVGFSGVLFTFFALHAIYVGPEE